LPSPRSRANGAGMASTSTSRRIIWTAAITKPRAEERAAHHVERQGFRYYLPRMAEMTRRHRERRVLMFPGWIFIGVRNGDEWRKLLSTRGISRLMTKDERVIPIPNGQIEGLMQREDARGLVRLQPPPKRDERVRVKSGAFEGLIGIVEGTSAAGRIIVLMEMMGRSARGEFGDLDLELVA
jgi:transcriptional antiterminator RfaH